MRRGSDWTRQELFNLATREAVHMMLMFSQTSYEDPDTGKVTHYTGEQHARQVLTRHYRDRTLTDQAITAAGNWIRNNPGRMPWARSEGQPIQGPTPAPGPAPEQLELAEDETDPFEEAEVSE